MEKTTFSPPDSQRQTVTPVKMPLFETVINDSTPNVTQKVQNHSDLSSIYSESVQSSQRMTLLQYFSRRQSVEQEQPSEDEKVVVMREIDQTVKEIDATLNKMISVAATPEWKISGAERTELAGLKQVIKD